MNKKVPLRMCVVCREMKPKNECIRVVRTTDDTYVVDSTGKLNGRGAYVCKNPTCLEKCKKTKALNKAFKHNVNEQVYLKVEESNIVE